MPQSNREDQKGLYGKYLIYKSDGSDVPEVAEYFVLRWDPFGDHAHVEASRKALAVYANEIEPYIPQLAKDIRSKLKEMGSDIDPEDPIFKLPTLCEEEL